jgi:UDP-glucose 4-epimerase
MRVLVTGATTRFGGALVAELLASSAVEHVLAVGPEPVAEGLPPASPRLSYREVDLARPRSIHDLLFGTARHLGVDAVVHDPSPARPRRRGRRSRAVEVEATRELLLLCERHPTIRRFVLRGTGDVYAVRLAEPNLLDEDQPLELDAAGPRWLRGRVEADLTACARVGTSRLGIAVLRCAEVLAAGTGSQLWDYLQSRVCLRPLGFDPMINLLSLSDAVRAVRLALESDARGVFNIPGADTLPLSLVVRRSGRIGVPLPGPLLAPLYRLRARTIGLEFRYDVNMRRFHFGGVLDGSRARAQLGYEPSHPLTWPSGEGQAEVAGPPPRSWPAEAARGEVASSPSPR